MGGVLIGFAIIGAIILVGYLVGRWGVLGDQGRMVLSRGAFYVFSPALLFTILADADVRVLFSSLLVASVIAAFAAFLIYVLIARLIWKRPVAPTIIGALSSGYVKANNIGIPVAVYVLGDTAYSAPVILMQLVVLTPIALTILDIATGGRMSVGSALLKPLKNPLLIGSALGVIVAVTEIEIPAPIFEPFRIVGAAAVPLVLIAFGMSLHGQKLLAPGSGRRDILTASAIKLAVMPLIAWVFGRFVFGLDGQLLFVVVVLAGLPTAQNIFVFAQRYGRGVPLARDVVLITTVGAVPVLVGVAALLAPAV